MNVIYKQVDELAPLAWIAYCNKDNVEVTHGLYSIKEMSKNFGGGVLD